MAGESYAKQQVILHRREVRGLFGHPARLAAVVFTLVTDFNDDSRSSDSYPFAEMYVTVSDVDARQALQVYASNPTELEALSVACHTAANQLAEWQRRYPLPS